MDPITGSLLAANTAAGLYGAFGKKSGPNYGDADALYSKRLGEIGDFKNTLDMARSKYLASLGNMYNDAYSRFSGNAEAGFANRGLAVNGGAFASALAKKTAEYQSELTPLAYNAEREDARYVDSAYAGAASMNASMRSGGPIAQYNAGREDSAALGRLSGNLLNYGLQGGFTGDKTSSTSMNSFDTNSQYMGFNPARAQQANRLQLKGEGF